MKKKTFDGVDYYSPPKAKDWDNLIVLVMWGILVGIIINSLIGLII